MSFYHFYRTCDHVWGGRGCTHTPTSARRASSWPYFPGSRPSAWVRPSPYSLHVTPPQFGCWPAAKCQFHASNLKQNSSIWVPRCHVHPFSGSNITSIAAHGFDELWRSFFIEHVHRRILEMAKKLVLFTVRENMKGTCPIKAVRKLSCVTLHKLA